jgi:hypothetical protein
MNAFLNSLYASTALFAAPDTPVSPGNGQDTTPPVFEKPKTKTKTKAKAAKESIDPETLPDEPQPAPKTPPPIGGEPRTPSIEDVIADDTVMGADGNISVKSAHAIKLRPLPKSKFFRAMPGRDNQLVVNAVKLEKEDTRPGEIDRFFLTNGMAKYFRQELNYPITKSVIRYVQIYQGQVFMTAVNASSELGDNSWNSSMRNLLLKAEKIWVRKTSNREEQEYGDHEAEGNVKNVKPRWETAPGSIAPIKDAFMQAVGKTLIADTDHPIVRRLRGMDGTEDGEDGDL